MKYSDLDHYIVVIKNNVLVLSKGALQDLGTKGHGASSVFSNASGKVNI